MLAPVAGEPTEVKDAVRRANESRALDPHTVILSNPTLAGYDGADDVQQWLESARNSLSRLAVGDSDMTHHVITLLSPRLRGIAEGWAAKAMPYVIPWVLFQALLYDHARTGPG